MVTEAVVAELLTAVFAVDANVATDAFAVGFVPDDVTDVVDVVDAGFAAEVGCRVTGFLRPADRADDGRLLVRTSLVGVTGKFSGKSVNPSKR